MKKQYWNIGNTGKSAVMIITKTTYIIEYY